MTSSDFGELRYHDDVLVILVRQSVLALAWYDAPRSGHLLEVLRQVLAVHRSTQRSPCLYNVVIGGTPRFPEDVREEGARLVRDTVETKASTAHIIEVDGFAGTATRMFLSTMLLVARRRPSVRVFGDHREGAKWLEEVNGAGVTHAEFLRLYEQLKSIAPKPPST